MRNILIPVLLLFFVSCQKVVDIDLNTTNPHLVVEGEVTDQAGPYTVKLSHTINNYDTTSFPYVSGALVTISDNAGNTEVLKEKLKGIYQTTSFLGVVGRTYTLKINSAGKEYLAISTMPASVLIDSVAIQKFNNEYIVHCVFRDTSGIKNYYQLQIASKKLDAIRQRKYHILSDEKRDGEEMYMAYRTPLKADDTLVVSLASIDKITYDFYYTLLNVAGDLIPFLSAPPLKPLNNISNDGLGYFSAYSLSSKSLLVK